MNIPYRVIKKLAFVTGFCIVSGTTALAQQQSLFVYLQSENQPFYVQMGDKVYSSSTIGHLVIAGLADKTCDFEIGFPQHTTQPQRFSIPLRNKDHGYQLVKNGSRGWALYDWQTDETIKPLKEAGNSTFLYGERKKDDAFADLMAAVVNDSAVLYTSIVKKESVAVPAVATTDAKPEEKQPEVKTEEKKVQLTDTVVSKTTTETVAQGSNPDTTNRIKKEPATTADAMAGVAKNTDSLVTKYDPKEKSLTEKPVLAGVVKIQQQTKDGETKMVFIDSSETPVKVVTVYINEEKKAADDKAAQTQAPVQPNIAQPVNNTPAANVVKNEPKEEPATQPAKQETAETVKKEVKKEEIPTAKETPATKELVAEQIKKETWRQEPEKKSTTGDTVTIILESRQMKKSTTAAEETPLFRTKQEPKAEPVKPTPAPDTTVIQMTAPAKQEVNTAATEKEAKKEIKQEPAKPVTEDKPVVKTEPAKVEVETKKESEPAPAKNDKEDGVRTEPQLKPAADTVKKAVMKPVTETAAQPAEPEKKAETGNKLVMVNSDCVKLATDNDVDKMRVKILIENDLQKKLAVANKYFKTMCLYAKQIKALSELFANDEAKYKFLELAYPFAADTANFKQLYELLTDEVYVTKFKKLVRLQ
ncbi:hypothetical protein A3860_19710 [Niastella vici]|uniref:DUF4476 domain-containing protein n=1 Tax=Niastella vici TaxID=1703345 RepID=A0A1V9G0W0_9BACT|nr:DUF4476 domain-containing protein [Niastella vici]OQP64207.1 hypothetical protein A3860_19710 [Niastella vici]